MKTRHMHSHRAGCSDRPDGFSLVEVLIALVFLTLAFSSLFLFFSSSRRGTQDVYREAIAHTLAQEALEWVSALGFEKLTALQANSTNALATRLGLDTFVKIDAVQLDDGSCIAYPEEYKSYERKIELLPFSNDRVMIVRVTIQPTGRAALRRGSIVLEKIVGAEYD